MVNIPFYSKAEDTQSLRECIDRIVRELGVSTFLAQRMITFFLEEVTEQVAKGKIVRLPGFGIRVLATIGRIRATMSGCVAPVTLSSRVITRRF